jgi:hypothetical protein
MIGAFANSSVFSSAGATQRHYYGYESFAFTLGAMGGAQLPSSPFSFFNQVDKLIEKLEEEGDLRFGANPQFLNAQFGLNTSKFLIKNLYLGLKLGFMKLNIQEVSFGTFSAGLLANYQLIKHKSIANGLVLWRGVNLGTGFIYQNTSLGFDLAVDDAKNDFYIYEYDYLLTATVDTKLFFDFVTNTYTIPLEAMTSIRLLWLLNIPFGIGADLAFGSSDLRVGGNAIVNFPNPPMGLKQKEPGSMSVTMGGNKAPNIVSPKLMTGLSFSLGPVILDVPFTYYFLDNGYNIGITFGVVK